MNVLKNISRTAKNSEERLPVKEVNYPPQVVQQMIQNLLKKVEEEIKDIEEIKSEGLLNAKTKETLMSKMKKNLEYLTKIKKFAKSPFLNNDHVYNRMLTSVINYLEKQMIA